MKILVYLAYAAIFTYCYFSLNKKLRNLWILIGYPLFFCASIYPIKLIFDAMVRDMGKAQAGEWLLLMLYAVSMLSLFNFSYGIVNNMVNRLVGFQQQYGAPERQPVKWYINNRPHIMNAYHYFFYTGGLILYAVVVFKSNI